uniref:Uncharacterized LOC100176241 n=1 Tax=Ciona intestinalis TaxID=7719 RepID=F6XRP1_CIOIN|nr:uncharacterized protein LOC100176241 [Ciona intestinalis]|eukprot:XP_002130245.1 uncharacterized protein LOC100176241 [Ciona intestinalis]
MVVSFIIFLSVTALVQSIEVVNPFIGNEIEEFVQELERNLANITSKTTPSVTSLNVATSRVTTTAPVRKPTTTTTTASTTSASLRIQKPFKPKPITIRCSYYCGFSYRLRRYMKTCFAFRRPMACMFCRYEYRCGRFSFF